MQKVSLLYIATITAILSACTPKVVSFTNDDMDLNSYKTYRLINFKADDKNFSEEGWEYFQRIESYINTNMEQKGFSQVEKGSDILVRYEVITTVATETNYNNTYYSPYAYYTPSVSVDYYKDGLLLIEFLDRKKKKLVWQGSLDIRYPKKRTKTSVLRESIDQIFETYNPQ